MKRKYPRSKGEKRNSFHQSFFRAPNPFAQMSEEQRDAASKAIAAHYESEYNESFAALRTMLRQVDPIQTLCHFAFYDLTLFEAYPEIKSDYRGAGQHHVELLQALLLAIPRHEQQSAVTKSETFIEVGRLLIRASEPFALRRLYPIDAALKERHFQALREDARIHTQAIRNWGYPEQVFRILTEMFGLFDADWSARRGFKISSLVRMCQNIFQLVEDRFEQRKKLGRPILKAKSAREAVETYYRTIPGIVGQSAEFLGLIEKAKLNLDETKSALMTHFDLSLRDCYTFSVDDFRAAFPEIISEQAIGEVLARWSLEIGELHECNAEHFFLGNPVWTRPLIRQNPQRFCWPVLELFLSFGLEMLQNILEEEPDLYRKYEEVTRPRYLEEKVANLFEEAFPTAQILKGSMWREDDSSAPYENDLLICLDSYLIVVEAKSGKVDATAKRGGDRLKKALTKLIVEPTLQADRFTRFLLEHPGPHQFSTKRGVINYCDTTAAKRIIRLNVTFELLGPLSAQRSILEKADLMNTDVPAAVTMSLTDLEIVFELLPSVHEKLHYFERRSEFERNVDFTADEIDLLAFYLQTGFNIGEDEYDSKNSFHLYGQSKVFDPYFLGKSPGEGRNKPMLKLTNKWRRILTAMEERQFNGWTQLGVCLLNVSYADQKLFERRLKQVMQNVRSRWHDPLHENTLILQNGPPQRRDAIVGYAYKGISRERRNAMINTIVSTAAVEASADRVAVIGVDCDEPNVPYSVLAFIPSVKLDAEDARDATMADDE